MNLSSHVSFDVPKVVIQLLALFVCLFICLSAEVVCCILNLNKTD